VSILPARLHATALPLAAGTVCALILVSNPVPCRAADEPAAPAAPAAPARSEAPPAESTPAASPADNAPDYARLAEPRIADALQLSDEQRAKLAGLLDERTQALAAPEAERAKRLEEVGGKLAALLNDEQRARFAQLASEPRLKFSFRFQRWADVLQWFAEQADLSLVLDAPPPGTFNYTDSRSYTPTEAIDLLNGVLQTKDFTLIRRNRMLLVVDLKAGLPEGAVPRVELGELDARGKYEFVTVLFPLGARNADEVDKEIKPLLGRHGKSVPLPKTRQLLVTDMAGVIRAVSEVIKSIPEPEKPPQPPQPPQPEKPALTVYPLKIADPNAAIETFKTLIPGATFVFDPKAEQLNAFATPSQHAAIKTVVDQMQAAPPEKQRRLELYPVETTRADQLLESLRLIAPQAQLRIDAERGRLVAWGTPDEHSKMQEALEKLQVAGAAGDHRQVEVYKLTKAEPSATLSLLQTLLPTARLSIDSATRSLVALAVPADQQIIRATLDQLQPEKPGPDTPELRFYKQSRDQSGSVVSVLQNLVPKAQVTNDADRERLLVIASPADHEVIKATLERFAAEGPGKREERNTLELYPVTPAQRKRFQAVLDSLSGELPGIRVITDAEPGELAVWAKPLQHALIADIIEKLKRDVPEDQKYQLVAYPIQHAAPQSVLTVLQDLYPSTRFVLDAKTGRLLVWTRPAEQEAIKKSIERIDAPGSAESREKLMLFPVTEADPQAALSTVQPLFPDTRLTLDSANRTIVAWGRPADLEKLGKTLEQFHTSRGVSQVYRLQTADPNAAYTVLQTLVPQARMAVDARNRSLVASALPEDHEKIKATIEQMDRPADDGDAPALRSYALKSADASTVLNMLQNLFAGSSETRLAAETRNDTIVALARPKEHEMIRSAIAELEKNQSGRTPRVYRFKNADPYAASTVLSTLTPKAQVAVDAKNRSLVVSAFPADHEKIEATLKQMDHADENGQAPVLRSYPLASAEPSNALSMLQTLFATSPEVRLSIDVKTQTIVALASPAQHETIAKSIQEIEKNAQGRVLAVYRFRSADPNAAATVLNTLTPKAQVAVDNYNRSLVVSALPEDQERIKATVAEIDGGGGTAGGTRRLVTYPLKSADTSNALQTLQTLFAQTPEARFSADYKNDTIVVFATADQQETVKKTIDELEKKESGRTARVYRFKNADPYAASTVLATLTPKAQVAVDSRNRTLVVSASEADHEKISATVTQMDAPDDEGQATVLRTYPVTSADPPSTLVMLQNLFAAYPEVRISLDARTDTIVALASAAQHEKIRTSIDELEKQGTGRTSRVYRFKNADPQSALAVLNNLTPRAQMAVDQRSRSLVVSASAYDHKKIEATVEQLDSVDVDDRTTMLQAYRLESADANSLLAVLQPVFAQQPEVRFSVDQKNGTLVALASAAQHKTIRTLVEQVDRDAAGVEPELEVFPLEVIEPFAAEMAIDRLFETSGPGRGRAPVVDSDSDTRQLFVRADKKQLDQIRALLVKMGETHLAIGGDLGKRKFRVIPFEGDARGAVEEIRRVWPQLRRNEIRVVTPSAVAPLLRSTNPRRLSPEPREDSHPQDTEKKPSSDSNGKAQFSVEDPRPDAGEQSHEQSGEPSAEPVAAPQADKAPSKPQQNGAPAEYEDAPANAAARPAPVEAQRPAAPVLVAPGERSITIASDDPEALDQLESLLRTMSNRISGRGRDYIVFSLRNASADRVAGTLQEVFRSGVFGGSSGTGRVVVVPDERLNALVVHANRTDRETIEELLTILDSADIPETLAANKPKLIPVKNTRASRVEDVLREIYKVQLTSGGGRKPIPVPSGVNPQVVAAIQQANAAGEGPLLTIGVDDQSNSLVVLAPPNLTAEIEQVVGELDQAAIGDAARGLKLIQLQKTNSRSVRKALDMILDEATRSRRPRSR